MESCGGGPDGLERIHRLERQQRALLSLAQARTPHGLLEGLAAAAVGLAVRLIELWARRTALSSSKVSDDHIERRVQIIGDPLSKSRRQRVGLDLPISQFGHKHAASVQPPRKPAKVLARA